MTQNLYNKLGIPFDANTKEIRAAYFESAKRLHPDTNPSEEDASEAFIELQKAYEVLSNHDKRKDYNAGFPDDWKDQAKIGVKVVYSAASLTPHADQQLVYALLELSCREDLAKMPRKPAHICLVIDRSTSMRGERLEQVRVNITRLHSLLGPNDLLSLVAFSDRAEVLLSGVRSVRQETLSAALNAIEPGGATEIYQGLNSGYQLLCMNPAPVSHKVLILLTDGHTYGDEEISLNLASQAALEGISISAFGFGSEWNDVFLDQLTATCGERAVFVASNKDLYKFLEQKLISLQETYAKGVTLHPIVSECVTLKDVFRIQPDEGPVVQVDRLALGDVRFGKSLRILFEFEVNQPPMRGNEFHLLDGQLWMTVPSLPIERSRFQLELKRPIQTTESVETPPSLISRAISRLVWYRMQEKARKEAAQGNIEKATRYLNHLATHMLSQGENDLAKTILSEAESLIESNGYSSEGEKRIKYGTRALFLLTAPEE